LICFKRKAKFAKSGTTPLSPQNVGQSSGTSLSAKWDNSSGRK
jgi:hypothetical protein